MNEQISLFDNIGTTKEEFAQKICDECNKLETVWKGEFYVEEVSLSWWNHVQLKNRVLEIDIKARNLNDENHLIQLKGDRESQKTLHNIVQYSDFIRNLCKDKDFDFTITPWFISVFYHNWELKKL